jgi:hypothetical protein
LRGGSRNKPGELPAAIPLAHNPAAITFHGLREEQTVRRLGLRSPSSLLHFGKFSYIHTKTPIILLFYWYKNLLFCIFIRF